jgi:hypothetical protein
MVRQLNDMLTAYSRLPGVNLDTDAVFKEIMDLMGIGGARFLKSKEEDMAIPPVREVPRAGQQRPLEETERVGEANTMERTGRPIPQVGT